jgi:hypothetical protein
MDNDILIDQARSLYAALQVEQQRLGIVKFDRLDRLIISAYCRYQRRLNRCALCYQDRLVDCNREFYGKFCPQKLSNIPSANEALQQLG